MGVSLETHEIKKKVITARIDRKNALKEELSDKFVFFEMDGCTGHRVNFLALNARFIHSKNMLDIKTLAVRDTQAHHSSNVPSNFFKECAQKYIHVQILHFFQKYVRSHASGRADYIIHCTTSFSTIKLHEKTSSYKIYMHYMCS